MILRACAVIAFLLTGLVSCTQTQRAPARQDGVPRDWDIFNVGDAFTFCGPASLREASREKSINPIVGMFDGSRIRVIFDYGQYVGIRGGREFRRETIVIDGREAILARADDCVALWVPKVTDTNWLTNKPMGLGMEVVCDNATAEMGVQILRSVRFTTPAPSTPAPVYAVAQDFVNKEKLKLSHDRAIDANPLGGGWHRVVIEPYPEMGVVWYKVILVSDGGRLVDPERSAGEARQVIEEIAGPAKDLAGYRRHVELYLKGFRKEPVMVLQSTKDIPGYGKHPLAKDLEAAVLAPRMYDDAEFTHCIVYSYQQAGGLVERWDFLFRKGRISDVYTLRLPGSVGDAFFYQ